MKVVIIGAGNVATVFGRLIKKANHQIVQVMSRKATTAKILADELGCAFTDNCQDIDQGADMYVVAMSDASLNNLKEDFNLGNKIVVHTAGSVSINILKEVSENFGVLYPLQSLRKENMDTQTAIPLLVDGNIDHSKYIIEAFAKTISNNVAFTDDEHRLKLHLAAVLVSNFTNHLYALAFDFCVAEKIDFKMLQPLIEETALRLRHHQPQDMQTGPAIRKDIITLDKQLRILSQHQKLRTVYLRMTDSIMNSEL